jgi:hypothetical protein
MELRSFKCSWVVWINQCWNQWCFQKLLRVLILSLPWMSPAVYWYHVQATLHPLSLHGACSSWTCYTFPCYEIRKTAHVLVKMAGLRDKPTAEFLGLKSVKIMVLCDVIWCQMLVQWTLKSQTVWFSNNLKLEQKIWEKFGLKLE